MIKRDPFVAPITTRKIQQKRKIQQEKLMGWHPSEVKRT